MRDSVGDVVCATRVIEVDSGERPASSAIAAATNRAFGEALEEISLEPGVEPESPDTVLSDTVKHDGALFARVTVIHGGKG